MNLSAIEWTDYTTNPIKFKLNDTGDLVNMCTPVSEGCRNCYASTLTNRFWPSSTSIEFEGYSAQMIKNGKFVVVLSELNTIIRRFRSFKKKGTTGKKIFWGSQTDLFHEEIDEKILDFCFATMALSPNIVHQVLTKRPERMSEYLNNPYRLQRITDAMLGLATKEDLSGAGYKISTEWTLQQRWPLKNVWLGTSVENQKVLKQRAEALLSCPAALHWLSCEPLIGSLDVEPYFHDSTCTRYFWSREQCICSEPRERHIGWIVVGGESGAGARPMHPNWVRMLRNQCIRANVPFFFKQWGKYIPADSAHMPLFEPEPSENELIGHILEFSRTFKEENKREPTEEEVSEEVDRVMCRPYLERGTSTKEIVHEFQDGLYKLLEAKTKIKCKLLDGVEHGAFPDIKLEENK